MGCSCGGGRAIRRSAAAVLFAACLVVSAYAQARAGAEETFDVPALIRESLHGGRVMRRRLSDYTFRMKVVFRETDRRGRVKETTRTYEMYGAGPRRPKVFGVKVEQDGARVSPGQLEKERARAGANMERAEREQSAEGGQSAERAAPGQGAAEPGYFTWQFRPRKGFPRGIRVSPTDFLEKCDFHSPRRGTLNGRDVIILAFRPRPGATLADDIQYLSEVEGAVWIDAADKVVIRLEAYPPAAKAGGAGAPAQTGPPAGGPAIVYEQVRTKEGVWGPGRVQISGARLAARPEAGGASEDIFGLMADYARFGVEAREGAAEPRP